MFLNCLLFYDIFKCERMQCGKDRYETFGLITIKL